MLPCLRVSHSVYARPDHQAILSFSINQLWEDSLLTRKGVKAQNVGKTSPLQTTLVSFTRASVSAPLLLSPRSQAVKPSTSLYIIKICGESLDAPLSLSGATIFSASKACTGNPAAAAAAAAGFIPCRFFTIEHSTDTGPSRLPPTAESKT